MSMFAEATKKAASARFKQPQLDAEGQEIEVSGWGERGRGLLCVCVYTLQYDVREDEEQNVKLKESIDLLLAAGYFRARIKGLTPFDKVSMSYTSVQYGHAPHGHTPNHLTFPADCWWDDMVLAAGQL